MGKRNLLFLALITLCAIAKAEFPEPPWEKQLSAEGSGPMEFVAQAHVDYYLNELHDENESICEENSGVFSHTYTGQSCAVTSPGGHWVQCKGTALAECKPEEPN